MKNLARLLPAVAASAALAFAAAGCGGPKGGDAAADPTKVLPAATPVYGELNVHPTGTLKAGLESFATKVLKTRDPGEKIIEELDKLIKKDDKSFSYKDDLEPWLGDKVGLAITSFKDPTNPDVLIVAAAKDVGKALDSTKGDFKDKRKYRDIEYRYDKTDKTAAAPVGDTLVVGDERAVKAAIDVKKGAASLAASPKLKSARSGVSGPGLAFFYLNLASTVDAVLASEPTLGVVAGPVKEALQSTGLGSIGALLSATPTAIRVEAATTTAAGAAKAGSEATDDAARTLESVPGTAALGLGLGDIGAAGKSLLGSLGTLGSLGGFDPQQLIGQLQETFGFDLQKDFLSWMGRGAIFVSAGNSPTDLGGALVVHSRDPKASRAAIGTIADILKRFSISTEPFKGAGVDAGLHVVDGDIGPFPLIVAAKGDTFVVAVGEGPLKEAFDPSSRLGDQPAFRSAAASLGDAIKPVFFLDATKVVTFLGFGAGSDPSFQKAKPYLDAFTALVVGAKRTGNTTSTRIVLGVR